MQFTRDGEFWRVARITGPSHNLLDLAVETQPGPAPALELLPATGDCSHRGLDPDGVVRAVMTAVDETNRKLGTSYSVRRIRVVSNDTPPEETYGLLAAAVLERIHAGDESSC